MRVLEFLSVLSVAIVIAVVVFGALNGWVIGIVPGVTYILAAGIAYLVYKQHVKERSGVMAKAQAAPESATKAPVVQEPLPQMATAVAFRIVGSAGIPCPLRHSPGQIVTVLPNGQIAPGLCPAAEASLRLAAQSKDQSIKEWCCPIYDHMLIFRREAQAA